ncbi:hypothetical protein GCM10023264_22500 [Sphingomonas daechungensis]|uniref:Uncharacterized protein n=1 Tax=Sphingomonas daechungensis TaxID=1176646 RepID=A0ABX6T439_9SPHN|nr:hypothetical protein [Sphingomonas daechungensis]QNP43677.1 hypothetical protein H9L15_03015 [Sphingomonas daechungensis]
MANPASTSAQRIRIGLTGLAFAFLLVLLGSVITRSREDPEIDNAQQLNTSESDEPLAQLGVAPGGDASLNNASAE